MTGSMVAVAVGLFTFGMAAWSLGEYVIHRFVMHELRGHGLPSREHLIHHADPQNNPGRPLLSWIGITVVGAVLWGPAGWILADRTVGRAWVGLAAFAGWLVGYGIYEQIHNRAHTHPPRGWYSQWVRVHHFHHHHGHPMTNHGVTTPLWDWVFGTLEVVDRVKVPRRHAMAWLLDGRGRVRSEYAASYTLIGPVDATDRQRQIDRARAFANLAPAAG